MNLKATLAKIIILALLIAQIGTPLFAEEDQFEIGLSVTGDVTAPTAPTGLSGTAISTSEIDLTWIASSDNVAVTGYRIYRDTVFIGTSATTNYSDTGLSADTSYSYTVSAVDAQSNESSQSTAAIVTTLSATSSSQNRTSGQFVGHYIYDVSVSAGQYSTSLSWKTTLPTVATVIARNTSGTVVQNWQDIVLKTTNNTILGGLIPGSSYSFVISTKDQNGKTAEYTGHFNTQPLPPGVPNVRGFVAIGRTEAIDLSWDNPEYTDFNQVRVVRSDKFFPADPFDGEIIYEGAGELWNDKAVEKDKKYYYTIFVEDDLGKFSSGAVASAKIVIPGETPEEPKTPYEEVPEAPEVYPDIQDLSLDDFKFIQDGVPIQSISKGSISIDGEKNLTVLIDYEKTPEVLKSIVITLSSPNDDSKVFSFLLRVNEDKSAYEATIGSLGESGIYGVEIAIIDYKNQGLKKIEGNLIASVIVSKSSADAIVKFFKNLGISKWSYLFIVLVLVAYGLKQIWFRENKKIFVVENGNS